MTDLQVTLLDKYLALLVSQHPGLTCVLPLQIHVHPDPQNLNLFGNKSLQMSLIKMRSYLIGMDTNLVSV